MSQDNLKVSESKEIKDNYQAVQTDKNEWLHSFLYLFNTLITLDDTSSERSNHIKSSFQIEDAFHGIAILSLSIVMEYLSMYSG